MDLRLDRDWCFACGRLSAAESDEEGSVKSFAAQPKAIDASPKRPGRYSYFVLMLSPPERD